MIINTGQRTDIPAFYSDWFYRRIQEGYVYVRNPYYPQKVMKYQLHPQLVDCLCFCTKNPIPMIPRLDEIKEFHQFWFITITPYGKDVEPYVPSVHKIIKSFQYLSQKIGKKAIGWRYDPIFINDKYTIDFHIKAFEWMASQLSTYTDQCVISFIDMYQKTKRNFPHVQEVPINIQHHLVKEFVKIAKKYHMTLYTCLESEELKQYGVNTQGCMTKEIIEKAIGEELLMKKTQIRKGCYCVIGNDIGAYNTCLHGCLYCYANENKKLVNEQHLLHDPLSPLLIGHLNEDDIIIQAKQESYINHQLSFQI